uniref:Malic acid transport protein n=1 Tax=Fusarium oxysporum (strain Fo5176) TaxID=660025 RepID=A0A0D2XVG8_FUSOF
MAPASDPMVAGAELQPPSPSPVPPSGSTSALATGYESPSEENPPFFSVVASAPAAPGTAHSRHHVMPRPALSQRPSYITAIAPEHTNGHARPGRLLNNESTLTSNSLNHVIATAEKGPGNQKLVSIFPVHTMTPTWVFPAYPLLLNAPFAANLIAAADSAGHKLSTNTVAMALGATAIQGTGCLIAFMISSAFIYRLMTQKLPRDMQRPGIFAAIIKVISILVSLWLWGLAMWFFIVCVGALWKYSLSGHHLPFQMTWWSFVFPNTALVTATSVMGKIFDSDGLHIFASVMTAAIIIVWALIFIRMCWSLKSRKLLWPKDGK